METVKISSRSMTCRYQLFRGESAELCAQIEIVTVAIKMDDFTSTEVPDDVKAVFVRHQAQ